MSYLKIFHALHDLHSLIVTRASYAIAGITFHQRCEPTLTAHVSALVFYEHLSTLKYEIQQQLLSVMVVESVRVAIWRTHPHGLLSPAH